MIKSVSMSNGILGSVIFLEILISSVDPTLCF